MRDGVELVLPTKSIKGSFKQGTNVITENCSLKIHAFIHPVSASGSHSYNVPDTILCAACIALNKIEQVLLSSSLYTRWHNRQ